jgi:hypothetical protein
MQQQNIEPRFLVPRHEHANPIASQFKVHSLVLDIAHAIHPETSVSLLEKNWSDGHPGVRSIGVSRGEVDFAHIVKQTGDGEDIQGTKSAFLNMVCYSAA